MRNIKAISTNIQQILLEGEDAIVLEDYIDFMGKSNVYLLRNNKIFWYAELPMEDDIYTGQMECVGDNLKLSSWKGFDVLIDIETGKILDSKFSK